MSPGSSPQPKQQEPSLQESYNSDSTRNTIRTVPYSPPKLDSEAGSPYEAESGAAAAAAGASRSNSQPDIFGPYRRKGSTVRPGTGSELSSTSTVRLPLAGAKGKAVSGTKPGSDSSGPPSPHNPANTTAPYGSNITRRNAPSPSLRSPLHDEHTTPTKQSSTSASTSSSNRARSASTRARHDRIINVHADKTFSIVLKPTGLRDPERPGVNVSSPPPSVTPTWRSSYRSSHEGSSFDATSADPPTSSAPSFFSERSGSPTTTGSVASTEVPEDFHTSPNYRIIGGLHEASSNEDYRQAKEDGPLPALQEELESSPTQPPPAAARKPFRFSSDHSDSDQTNSTLGNSANFTVLRPSSPAPPPSDIEEQSPGQANYQVLGESSDEASFVSSLVPPVADTRADSPGSRNYVVLGDSSSSSASVDDTPTRGASRAQPFQGRSLHQQFSQDSLVVRPLTTHRQSVFGVPEYDRPRSIATESIRPRAHSFSSISSVLTQDAPSLGNTPNVVRLGQDTPSVANTPSAGNTPTSTSVASTPNFIRLGRTRTSSIASLPQPPLQPPPTWAGPSAHVLVPYRMEAHAHQWSSQLSTVASESEPSERTSRHLSSAGFSGSNRLSYGSGGIRHVPSIESSMILADDFPEPPHQLRHQSSVASSLSEQHEAFSYLGGGSSSRSRSLSSPSPALGRSRDNLRSPPLRVVRDLDEDGDGLADLGHLRHMSSSGRFLNRQPSDRDLRSSSGSRPSSRPGSSTGSIIASSLPAWARVYYGSGERRWAPSIRSYSDDSRPVSAIPESGSPADYNFPSHLHQQRRRPREMHPLEREELEHIGIRRSIRRMTSSIWSPHLQTDRRAATFSMWVPPPTITWGPGQGPFDRRNIQVIMFALGWIFPFAWMIAAFLPLPQKPSMDTTQRLSSTRLEIPEGPMPNVEKPRFDDKKFLSARWWRNINRLMSVVGLLLIGAIVALIVIGLRDNWGK